MNVFGSVEDARDGCHGSACQTQWGGCFLTQRLGSAANIVEGSTNRHHEQVVIRHPSRGYWRCVAAMLGATTSVNFGLAGFVSITIAHLRYQLASPLQVSLRVPRPSLASSRRLWSCR